MMSQFSLDHEICASEHNPTDLWDSGSILLRKHLIPVSFSANKYISALAISAGAEA